MDSRSIEMRLRLAAPDEPAVLPPLVLPALDGFGRATPTVSFRRATATPAGNRLVYALVALVLLMLAVIAVGALRIKDNALRTGDLCSDPSPLDTSCFTMAWPDGWHQLAAGTLFPGDFTEPGIAYETVRLVVASVAMPGCGSAGGPLPTPYESGSVSYFPRATPDAGLACLRTNPLPDGAVRISAEVGYRSPGLAAPDGPAIQDASEPTPESGWTEKVADRPARLAVTTGTAVSGAPLETRIWDIIVPDSIDRVLRVQAEIAGPDLAKGRADVQSIVESIRFAVAPQPIDPAGASGNLKAALDQRDHDTRQSGSDFFGCFPREPGSREGTISGGPGELLPAPVAVTCRTSIEASAAGLWRVRLEMEWPAGDGYPSGGRIEELFVRNDGAIVTSFTWRLDGGPLPVDAETALLPMAPPELPPLLAGPLNLPIGSIVEMLYPGQYPDYEPNPANEDLAPGLVGRHFQVVDGPRIVGGDEWYEVQTPDQGLNVTAWARGTFHGRPMLAVVPPACPPEPVEIDRLTLLPAYEQLACLGTAEVGLSPVVAANIPAPEPALCMFEGPVPTACPLSVGSPAWLTNDPRQQLFGAGGPQGAAPGLQVWLDPALDSMPSGVWLRVRGHFDDHAAAGCSWTSSGPQLGALPPAEVQVLLCRERFVITGFEATAAP